MSVFRYSHAFKCLIDYPLKQLLLLAKYDRSGLHLVGHITDDASSGTIFVQYALSDDLENYRLGRKSNGTSD